MCEVRECKPPKKIKMLRVRKIPSCTDTGEIWKEIVDFDKDMKKLYDEKKAEQYKRKFAEPDMISKYLEREVYPSLIPAFEYACAVALNKRAHEKPKQIFNFIDTISEYLYHVNPKFPYRKRQHWKSSYTIFKNKFKIIRPVYPLHWIISKDEAALMIQRYVRGYNIRKIPEVQEMRKFWKQIELDSWEFKPFIQPRERVCPPRLPREERLF